jgi:hypothetical protein
MVEPNHENVVEKEPVIDLRVPAETIDLREPIGEAELTGKRYLDEFCQGDPYATAVNYAVAMAVTLRYTDNALSTGRDLSTLRVPSQTLLTDILDHIELDPDTDDPVSQKFYELVSQPYTRNLARTSMIRTDMRLASETIRAIMQQHGSYETQQLYEDRLNIRPFIREMQILAEGVVDTHVDKRSLTHEGGSIEELEPEIFLEFMDQDYLELTLGKASLQTRSGLTGQVRLRLLQEAKFLHELEAVLLHQAQE